jgi:hypothetical protein
LSVGLNIHTLCLDQIYEDLNETSMKNLIVLFVLFTGVFQVDAQEYTPFDLSDGTVWQESYQLGLGSTPGAQGYHTTSYSYLLSGDTIMNGYVYKKVYSRMDWEVRKYTVFTGPDMEQTDITAHNFEEPYLIIGAIRQEIEDERVYFVNWIDDPSHFSNNCRLYIPPFGEEVLMYNYNVAQGDTVWVGDQIRVVSQVGTVEMADGSLRKQVTLQGGYPSWVAELGGEFGLFSVWQEYPFESGCFLLCYKEEVPSNDLWTGGFYTGTLSASCDQQIISSSKEPFFNDISIQIGPNPIQDDLEIRSSPALIRHQPLLYIFNSIGQLVRSVPLTATHQVLCLQNQAQGVYFVHIAVDGQAGITRKIIKY